jgi:hypothetical protein
MDVDARLGLLVAAVVTNAMVVGASLDQSIKQLPARRRIGVLAFSAYSQAADLWHGLVWYPALGVGTALVTLAAAVVGLVGGAAGQQAVALVAAAAGTLAHSMVTTRAAPTLFAQRRVGSDEAALARIFDQFERLHTVRAVLQVATLAAVVWALAAAITTGGWPE